MTTTVRRLIYASQATGNPAIDLFTILATSRANNGLDGITGVLWVAEGRYIQVLEGPDESVELTFARIRQDFRHREIEVLRDEQATEREFGDWHMAAMPGERPADAKDRLRRLLAGCAPEIVNVFATAA